MRWILLVAATLVTGCAAHKPDVGGLPAEPTLEDAYATVRSGQRSSARAEGWVLESVGDGRVRVLKENPVAGVGDASDSAITHRLREELAPLRVQVRTDAGVVTLRGWLGTQADALKAIRRTLAEKGVSAVEIELQFPVNEAKRDDFGDLYGAVKTGDRAVAHSGGWVLEKAGDGVVRVVEPSRTGKARIADDDWITRRLKDEPVDVQAKDGVVTLKGTVTSPHEAERMIQRALDTPGVGAVDAQLAWPQR
jgi:osmotically-inducible protein OsmY